jgi:hypothetical protein
MYKQIINKLFFMKTLNKFLLLAIMAVFSFSCGGDDDPVATEVNKTVAHTWAIPIRGIAKQTTTTDPITIALKDVLGETDAKNFISGTFQIVPGNSIELTKTAPLESITLKAGADTYTITDFANVASPEVIAFLNKIFNGYISKNRSITVTATFTPTADILGDDVKLNISIKALYKWNTY